MSISVEQVTDALLSVRLVDEAGIAEACHELSKLGGEVSGQRLLETLKASGKLTPYQAEEIEQGREAQLALGSYLVLSRIGEGGMGVVFKALHRRMHRVVAVKVLRRDVATREFVTRFRREILMSARLNHPNVVIAFDSDECELGDFLVMEYVEGTDLSAIVRQSGPLSVADAVSSVRQAAAALAYAHRMGVVHRDVKPANLLRDVSGCVKVVDLGLARLADLEPTDDRTALTQAGMVMGTVDFMPPEQATSSAAADHRCDIYSLGCTLFYLLTGGAMFPKATVVARLLAHQSEPAPSLQLVCEGVPKRLDAIFQQMVAKASEDRFATMDDVVEALANCDVSPATVPQAPTQAPTLIANLSAQANVVLVEESRVQAAMIRKLLVEIGVTDVQVCSSGREALDRLRTKPADVLLGSMKLSDMSGLELANRVRDELRWLRMAIVLMSGDEFKPNLLEAIFRLGGVSALKKPFDVDGLRNSIEQTLRDEGSQRRSLDGLSELQLLIVDDSSVARRHIRSTLSDLGFARFTEAEDGDDAVELLRQARFDLIVTDYNMPRMDGRELIAHIRQSSSHRNVPIIMVTTEFDPRKLAAIYQLGVSAICNKSFERELVRNIVIQLFA